MKACCLLTFGPSTNNYTLHPTRQRPKRTDQQSISLRISQAPGVLECRPVPASFVTLGPGRPVRIAVLRGSWPYGFPPSWTRLNSERPSSSRMWFQFVCLCWFWLITFSNLFNHGKKRNTVARRRRHHENCTPGWFREHMGVRPHLQAGSNARRSLSALKKRRRGWVQLRVRGQGPDQPDKTRTNRTFERLLVPHALF